MHSILIILLILISCDSSKKATELKNISTVENTIESKWTPKTISKEESELNTYYSKNLNKLSINTTGKNTEFKILKIVFNFIDGNYFKLAELQLTDDKLKNIEENIHIDLSDQNLETYSIVNDKSAINIEFTEKTKLKTLGLKLIQENLGVNYPKSITLFFGNDTSEGPWEFVYVINGINNEKDNIFKNNEKTTIAITQDKCKKPETLNIAGECNKNYYTCDQLEIPQGKRCGFKLDGKEVYCEERLSEFSCINMSDGNICKKFQSFAKNDDHLFTLEFNRKKVHSGVCDKLRTN